MNRQGTIEVWQNSIFTWGKRISISALNCSAICISSMDGFNSTDGTGKLNDLRWSNCGMIWWRNVSRLSPLLQAKFKYCKFGQSIGRSCQWNELATGMPKWEHWRLRWVSNGLCISKRRDHSPKQLSIKYNSLSAGRKSVAGIADKWRSLDSDDLKEEPQIDNVSSLARNDCNQDHQHQRVDYVGWMTSTEGRWSSKSPRYEYGELHHSSLLQPA